MLGDNASSPTSRLGACTLRVASLLSVGILADAAGSVRVGVPVPATPSLLGAELVWQAVLADAGGALFGVAAMTDGLRTVFWR